MNENYMLREEGTRKETGGERAATTEDEAEEYRYIVAGLAAFNTQKLLIPLQLVSVVVGCQV